MVYYHWLNNFDNNMNTENYFIKLLLLLKMNTNTYCQNHRSNTLYMYVYVNVELLSWIWSL